MKSYLAAVRHEQIRMALEDQESIRMPRVEYIVKGANSETRSSEVQTFYPCNTGQVAGSLGLCLKSLGC